MAYKDASREAHFPAIERRYGEKMAYWFKVMAKLSDAKYPEQIAHLKENYGFSQTHANALVMYSRGSKSAKRFDSHYFRSRYLAKMSLSLRDPISRRDNDSIRIRL